MTFLAAPFVSTLLADRSRAEQIGQRARERVRERFTSVRSLLDYLALIRKVSGSAAGRRAAA